MWVCGFFLLDGMHRACVAFCAGRCLPSTSRCPSEPRFSCSSTMCGRLQCKVVRPDRDEKRSSHGRFFFLVLFFHQTKKYPKRAQVDVKKNFRSEKRARSRVGTRMTPGRFQNRHIPTIQCWSAHIISSLQSPIILAKRQCTVHILPHNLLFQSMKNAVAPCLKLFIRRAAWRQASPRCCRPWHTDDEAQQDMAASIFVQTDLLFVWWKNVHC